jgi:hypothetical protein
LVVRRCTRGLEVLTIDGNGEVLPVFGFKEEAEMFLRLGVSGTGWRVRETTRGELVSVLYAPCRDVRLVALDPLPEMAFESTVGFVSLGREAFVEVLLPSNPIPSAVEEPRTIGVAS